MPDTLTYLYGPKEKDVLKTDYSKEEYDQEAKVDLTITNLYKVDLATGWILTYESEARYKSKYGTAKRLVSYFQYDPEKDKQVKKLE